MKIVDNRTDDLDSLTEERISNYAEILDGANCIVDGVLREGVNDIPERHCRTIRRLAAWAGKDVAFDQHYVILSYIKGMLSRY